MKHISNPLLSLFFETSTSELYRQRNEALEVLTRKFDLCKEMIAGIEFNGRFNAIGVILLRWCLDETQASVVSAQMQTEAERSSFSVLINNFRRGMKNVYSSDKLIRNPLAPSVTAEVADSIIAPHLAAEMILEVLFLHVARFGARVEPE